MKKIRILIVDDHTMFREGLHRILEDEIDIEIAGEASNGKEAIKQAAKLKPSIILMDIMMPDVNGIRVTQEIIKNNSKAKIIIVTMWKREDFARQAIKAGAKGYIVKKSSVDELLMTIREVEKGNAFFSPCVAHALIGNLNHENGKNIRLSLREIEVLKLIAEGKSNKEIGCLLSLRIKTVANYRQHLMKKLDLHDTASLTRYAIFHKIST